MRAPTRNPARRLQGPLPDDVPRVPGLTLLRPVGGDGPPWRARDTTTGQELLVRPMPPRADPDRLDALPDHPHLLVPRSRPDGSGRPFLTASAAGHGDLAALLRRRRRLTPPEVSMLAVTLGRALTALHAHGLVHGAVGAEHVLVGVEARPLLDAAPMAAPARAGARPSDDVRDLGLLLARVAGDDLPMGLRVVVSAASDDDPALRPTAAQLVRDATAAVPPQPLRLRADDPDEVGPAPAGRAARRRRRRRRPVGVAAAWVRGALAPGAGPGRVVGLGVLAASVLLALLVTGLYVVPGLSRAAHEPPASAAAPDVEPVSAGGPAGGAGPAEPRWGEVLAAIDRARQQAFSAADATVLGRVDRAASAADARDREAVAALVSAGVRARGFAQVVLGVEVVERAGDRVVLLVRDERPAYDLVDASGRVVEHRAARAVAEWRVLLVDEGDRWLVDDVRRS